MIGGGVSELAGMFPRLRRTLATELAGYATQPEHRSDDFVVPPGLGSDSGTAGAIALAETAT